MPDPKTFDRAFLTPRGFVRDPEGDVLIIPDDFPSDDVPEWTPFIRECNLPLERAYIRARLKNGYFVFVMFDKGSNWWGARGITPAGQAPSIRLARYHAFQALAQRVLEDDPTNEDALYYAATTLRRIARGDRESTASEALMDLLVGLQATGAAEQAKKEKAAKAPLKIGDVGAHGTPIPATEQAAKPPVVAVIPAGTPRPANQWHKRDGDLSWIFENVPPNPNGLRAYVTPTHSWAIYEDARGVGGGSEGSYERNLVAADREYRARKTARDAAKDVPTVVDPVFDRWFRYERTDAGKEIRRHADFNPFTGKGVYAVVERAGGWRVYRDDKVVQSGQATDFPTALLDAERAYITETEGQLPALPKTVPTLAPTPPVAKPPEGPTIPEVAPWGHGSARLFDRWFSSHPNRGIVAYKDSGEFKNLSAYAYADKWGVWVGEDKRPVEGDAGSFEQNLIAAERAYSRELRRRRTAVLVSGRDNIEVKVVEGRRPVGEWYIWRDGDGSRFKVYSDNADELYARAGTDGWEVRSGYKKLAKGNAGDIEANTRAAERLYQHYAAEKDAKKKAAQAATTPAEKPPAKDRYEIRRNTVDVYTTPTHIAIGQVWRTPAGDTALVAAVTTFEDNYAADNNSDMLTLEYDKAGRITNYGGCTYVGYVPVVWLDKVPSGG